MEDSHAASKRAALVAVGTKDDIAGSPHELAALMPNGRGLDIPERDHMVAVGDKVFKAAVIEFLNSVHEVFAAVKHLQPATAMFKGAAGNKLVADVYRRQRPSRYSSCTAGGRRAMPGGAPPKHLGARAPRPMRSTSAAMATANGSPAASYAFTDFAADAAAVAAN